MNLKDGLTNISDEFKKEWKIVNTQLNFIYPLAILLVLGLIVACLWFHQDYKVMKNRLEKYTSAQENYFKDAGMNHYKVWQSFNEDEGQVILNPDDAIEFRSENY